MMKTMRIIAMLIAVSWGGVALAQVPPGQGCSSSPRPQCQGARVLSAGTQLLLFGSSIMANADEAAQLQATCDNSANSYTCYTYVVGSAGTWFNYYLGDRVARPSFATDYRGQPGVNNFGLSGDTCLNMATTAVLAPVVAAASLTPTIVIQQCGENDVAVGTETVAQIEGYMRTIWTGLLLNAGATVVYTTIYPRSGGYAWSTTQAKQVADLNAFAKQFATENSAAGFYVVDLDNVMANPASTSFTATSNYLQDGVNPSAQGGSAIAAALAQVVGPLLPGWTRPTVNASDVYDATNNPRGNLLTNGGFQTTTGGTLHGGATGTVPSGWGVYAGNAGGMSVAASTETETDGSVSAVMAFSGSYTNAGSAYINQAISAPSSINPGDVIAARCWVSVGSNTNLTFISLQLYSTESGTTHNDIGGNGSVSQLFPANGWAYGWSPAANDNGGTGGWVANPAGSTKVFVPIDAPLRTIAATPSLLGITLQGFAYSNTGSNSIAATIAVRGCEIRKVAA